MIFNGLIFFPQNTNAVLLVFIPDNKWQLMYVSCLYCICQHPCKYFCGFVSSTLFYRYFVLLYVVFKMGYLLCEIIEVFWEIWLPVNVSLVFQMGSKSLFFFLGLASLCRIINLDMIPLTWSSGLVEMHHRDINLLNCQILDIPRLICVLYFSCLHVRYSVYECLAQMKN